MIRLLMKKKATKFHECFSFGRYRDDSLVLWCRNIEKLKKLHKMLNILDKKIKFTMEIGGNSIFYSGFKNFYSK